MHRMQVNLIPTGPSPYVLVNEATSQVVDHVYAVGADEAKRHWRTDMERNPDLKVYIRVGGQD